MDDTSPAVADLRRPDPGTYVDLYWLPLGAGGHSVRLNGRVYECAAALVGRRRRYALYHSALEVRVPEGRYIIEMAPAARDPRQHGAVATGPVGLRAAGGLRMFRYEVRCWRDGVIPDVAEAVDSPRRLTGDAVLARRVLDLVLTVPAPVWGRDELRTGEMWNSNSLVAWLIVRADLDIAAVRPPDGGRAPGWDAGVATARRPR